MGRRTFSFHRAIVIASHNDFMMRLVPITNRAIQEILLLNYETEALSKDTLQDHAQLMDFLKKRDVTGAKYAMSIHLHRVISTMKFNDGDDPIF